MFEWFTRIAPAAQILAMIFFPLAIVASVAIIAAATRRNARVEQRTRLMAKMLERGMTPEEIGQTLLTADLTADGGVDAAADLDPEVRVVKHLNKCWYTGTDVEQILDAARGPDGTIDDQKVRIIMSMASHWNGTNKIVAVLKSKNQAAATA